MTQPTAKDHEQQLIDYLISKREAVEYGEPWTPETTHEWWIDSAGTRHCRLVQTYHGGGGRGDDDENEYAQRLLDLGRAVYIPGPTELTDGDRDLMLRQHPDITHVVISATGKRGQRKAVRIRRYSPPPEGL
jgi:hypothetical protein